MTDISPEAVEHIAISLQWKYPTNSATLRALSARVAELEAEQKWQPIETIPKDGDDILIYPYGGKIISCTPFFADGHALPLTHWQPLPTPPKETP